MKGGIYCAMADLRRFRDTADLDVIEFEQTMRTTGLTATSTGTEGSMKNTTLQKLAAITMVAVTLGASQAHAGVFFLAAKSAAAKRVAKPVALAPKAPVTHAPGKPHDVIIQRSRYPQAASHIDDAQRQGQPSVVHIDRAGASARRRASTGSVRLSRKPGQHAERDEYPPAFVREGGGNANVRFIDRRDNRGAGASMGTQTRKLPDGSKIRIIVSE